jgi:VanZ family protein
MHRIIALGTLGVYWIGIFVGTHLPDIGGVGKVYDKFLHFGAYAGLAFLLAATLATIRLRHGTLLVPVIVAAIYGCFDELSQMAVPGRQCDVADWAADVFGAGVGVLAFGLVSLAIAKFIARSRAIPGEAIPESAA